MKDEKDPGRFSLRIPKELYYEIDLLRTERPGNISRNTWIAEAIREKLDRDRKSQLRMHG